MQKRTMMLSLTLFSFVVLLYCCTSPVYAAVDAPYFTYTSDSKGFVIMTQAAYTPTVQISTINGQKLETPEHVFVDDQDNVYITDSTLSKVFILDPQYRFVKELTNDKFKAIKSTFVTDQFIYVVDTSLNVIFVLDKATHQLLKEIGKPDSPIFQEGYEFSPTHIAVDVRGNIYVRSTGSVNGLIMLNGDGEFVTFFGANPMQTPLLDRLRSFFLTKTQQDKIKKVLPDVPSNIAIDKTGFIYTVTSSVEDNPVKKFNVSGKNYFPDKMVGMFSMESVWVGQHHNVFSVSSDGWIFEYDTNGNLLFLFGGKDFTSSRLGLLNRPVALASNSSDELIVVDQGLKLLQCYRPTEFSNAVHQAMDAYQDGDYDKSKKLWEYTLKYNSLFDNAHVGLGNAYLREGNASGALAEFEYAKHNNGMSEAFWEIRQGWLQNNLGVVFSILLTLILGSYASKWLNRRYGYVSRIGSKLQVVRRVKIIDNLLYMFTFLRHPLDGLYHIKYENRVSRLSSTVIYVLVTILLIVHYEYANPLFVKKQDYFLYTLMIMVGLAVLWMLSNYLICSITDGEGKFRDVYNATAYSISPLIVILPPLILFSRGLTLEQSVFYDLPIQAMILWIAFLMFFMIKDIHNYEAGETVDVIFRSLFTMLVIGLFLFVFYSIGSQFLGFLHDVVTEAGSRWQRK
ncbi:YIP1 family protein [Paenibacillus sp. KQZ6P-2]|uniref:YIP1 family protein n=1 Tax=Paenibacillus mangrovi TaxID=2931978 RepID=A0A9X1WN32_9BACL|nr:YIP1 family protein [Paenibacillus mangrovi]MCJ8010855.1 YIP1 family protein [Paenibacillus mangrovi]